MLIKYGLALDCNRKTAIITDKINHKVATEDPSHVDVCLTEEIEYGAMGALSKWIFYHVPIDPGDLGFLGLHWGHYYIDFLLLFSLKYGSLISTAYPMEFAIYYETGRSPNLDLYR